MEDEKHDRVPWDFEGPFSDPKNIEVTLTLPTKAGLWKWVRAKADYEGISHEEEVTELIYQQFLAAVKHAKNHGYDLE